MEQEHRLFFTRRSENAKKVFEGFQVVMKVYQNEYHFTCTPSIIVSIVLYIISSVMHVFLSVLTYDLLEDRL